MKRDGSLSDRDFSYQGHCVFICQRYTHIGNICTETLKTGWRNLVNLYISLGIGEKPRAFWTAQGSSPDPR